MTKKKDQEFHNPLELIFAKIAAFVSKNKIAVIIWTVLSSLVLVAAIAIAVFYDFHNRNTYARYDAIVDEYFSTIETDPAKTKQASQKAASDFELLAQKALFGYVKKNSLYILAGFYYSAEDYSKAGELYKRFYNERQKSAFRPLAMIQAGLCAEEMNDYDLAYDTYSLADEEYGKTELHGELVYNMGRIMQLRNETSKANELFQRVVAEAPGTEVAELARQRLAGL